MKQICQTLDYKLSLVPCHNSRHLERSQGMKYNEKRTRKAPITISSLK